MIGSVVRNPGPAAVLALLTALGLLAIAQPAAASAAPAASTSPSDSGTLTAPNRSPVGLVVSARPLFDGPTVTATADAAGRWSMTNLREGTYDFTAASVTGTVTEWAGDFVTQHGNTPATHRTHDDHVVHSSYDLRMDLGWEPDSPSWAGSTARLHAIASDRTWNLRLDSSVLTPKPAQFVVPSGRYLLEVDVVEPDGSSVPLWWGGDGVWNSTRAEGSPITIRYGQLLRLES